MCNSVEPSTIAVGKEGINLVDVYQAYLLGRPGYSVNIKSTQILLEVKILNIPNCLNEFNFNLISEGRK